MRTWGGTGVSVLVCTRGAAFEMDWWKFRGVSVDITYMHAQHVLIWYIQRN